MANRVAAVLVILFLAASMVSPSIVAAQEAPVAASKADVTPSPSAETIAGPTPTPTPSNGNYSARTREEMARVDESVIDSAGSRNTHHVLQYAGAALFAWDMYATQARGNQCTTPGWIDRPMFHNPEVSVGFGIAVGAIIHFVPNKPWGNALLGLFDGVDAVNDLAWRNRCKPAS
ncbi:MAG: hypothetical protein WAN50_03855 [Minisyncoccia bacterium]